jgi:hypothetical protein
VSQCPEIHEKKMKNSYKSKDYTLPSGRIVKLQGYEDKALTILLMKYDESDIMISQNEIPTIDWVDRNNIHHVYLPDFYIISENLIIEVKSDYTYNADLEMNLLKKEYTEKAGYNFEFMIL